MKYILIIFIGYLLGNSNMATYIARFHKVDLKAGGSGNPGASNAMLLMGWKAGILVALHDILKAVIAVLLCGALFKAVAYAGVLSGVSSVMGHMFPLWLKFKGGKGFASFLGMALALNFKFALIICVSVVVLTLITDYIVVGTMTTIICVPVYFAVTGDLISAAIISIASIIILYKHRMNLVRIWKGTEIGLRSGHKGEHRIKTGE